MNRASALRSFAIAADVAAGLLPRLATAKAVTKGEAELLARQLKAGAETVLDVVVEAERDTRDLLEVLRNFTDGRDISYVEALTRARVVVAKFTGAPDVARS